MQAGRVAKASGLVLLMVLSTVAAPASAQEVVEDPKQPSVDNPHMHIYGNDDLSNCFSHFDGNDTTGSSDQGYGEEVWPNQNGQQIEMDYTCKMDESFKQDMYLNSNGTIHILLNFRIDAEGECSNGRKCENLNLTLYKGTFQVARQEFPLLRNGQDDTVNWEIQVDENMTRFNRTEEPQIRVEFSYPGYDNILPCALFYCGGSFRMYYHDPGNDTAEVEFPVVNQTMPGEGGDGDEGGLGGLVSDTVPGFGLVAGLGALALAAVAGSRFSREE